MIAAAAVGIALVLRGPSQVKPIDQRAAVAQGLAEGLPKFADARVKRVWGNSIAAYGRLRSVSLVAVGLRGQSAIWMDGSRAREDRAGLNL